MSVFEAFDAVIILAWSDWKTEPRSNRYHYAKRFAEHLPVYFVQPDGQPEHLTYEEVHPVTIVHVSYVYDEDQSSRIAEFLRQRGAHRILAWIYNVHFTIVLDRLLPKLSIFHATEDYASSPERLRITPHDLRKQLQLTLDRVDRVISVSEGVAQSYASQMRLSSTPVVLPNGCDYDFWYGTGAHRFTPRVSTPVALYQGGINDRLDYDLLLSIAESMSDWEFWFCGRVGTTKKGWTQLLALPNVKHHGEVGPEEIARLAKESTAGLIPFLDDGFIRRSLPLKAFEYVACGLPVVTTPIDSLNEHPSLFVSARTVDEFIAALRKVAPSRSDEHAVAERLKQARGRSYDHNFEKLSRGLASDVAGIKDLNVLILFDDASTHVATIKEHLRAFRKYSDFHVHYMSATGDLAGAASKKLKLDFSLFDAVMIHYSIRVSVNGHLSPLVERALQAYDGPKFLFIQDEYDTTNTSLAAIERLGISVVFTNVPAASWEGVYPKARFPDLKLVPTLTGYVPEDPTLETFVTPIEQREVRIGYRGRRLPHHYGELGFDKYRIGMEVKEKLRDRNIPVDIEVDDAKRIYGTDWYRFVGSVRATLGTESGSGVFDFDGRLARLALQHADMDYREFADRFLKGEEDKIRMNQISPRVFEAIRLRTALVLFEGEYSGILVPWRHYLPLKKNYENLDEILAQLEDAEFLRTLTEQAYNEIVMAGKYSYATLVRSVDAVLRLQTRSKACCLIYSAPTFAVSSQNVMSIIRNASSDVLISHEIMARTDRIKLVRAAGRNRPDDLPDDFDFRSMLQQAVAPSKFVGRLTAGISDPLSLYAWARRIWHLLPAPFRTRVGSRPWSRWNLARSVWHVLPSNVRTRVGSALNFNRRRW